MTLSLVNLELYVLRRSTNRLGLKFRWAWSKLDLTIETSVSLAQQIQWALLLHFNQLQTNPGAQEPQRAQARIPAQIYPPQATFYATNGYVCFEVQGKCGKTFYCSVSLDLVVHVVRWPYAMERGNGKLLTQRVCKLTCFTLPECWTGIEKEIVYIQMLATRCLLFLPSCFPITEETWPI